METVPEYLTRQAAEAKHRGALSAARDAVVEAAKAWKFSASAPTGNITNEMAALLHLADAIYALDALEHK